jgi:hypothetical protein
MTHIDALLNPIDNSDDELFEPLIVAPVEGKLSKEEDGVGRRSPPSARMRSRLVRRNQRVKQRGQGRQREDETRVVRRGCLLSGPRWTSANEGRTKTARWNAR